MGGKCQKYKCDILSNFQTMWHWKIEVLSAQCLKITKNVQWRQRRGPIFHNPFDTWQIKNGALLCPSNHLHHWKKWLCDARVQRQTKFTVLHCCHLSQFFCNPALHHQAQKMCSKWQISIPGIALISGKLEALIDIMPWHSYFRKQWAQNPIAWKMIAAIQTAANILILLGFENTEKYIPNSVWSKLEKWWFDLALNLGWQKNSFRGFDHIST